LEREARIREEVEQRRRRGLGERYMAWLGW